MSSILEGAIREFKNQTTKKAAALAEYEQEQHGQRTLYRIHGMDDVAEPL